MKYGIKEVTFYGFTKDNNKRAVDQREAFTQACVDAVALLSGRDANLLVIGNTYSVAFPEALKPYANHRVHFGQGLMNINFLVNYDWEWDLGNLKENKELASQEISRIDLHCQVGRTASFKRFSCRRNPSYADFYIINDYWPDFKVSHIMDALKWYQDCDVTLGG